MEQETDFVVVDGVVVPESALRRAERRNPYGGVPGLDEEELAQPEELERQVMMEEWGPVLALPVQGKAGGFRPELNENGVDWSPFASVDFERTMPECDKARYRADKLREKLGDLVILIDLVKRRLPKAMYSVLKYLRMKVIGLEHVTSDDMRALAKLDQRARQLQKEIAQLRTASWERQKEACRRMLARLE